MPLTAADFVTKWRAVQLTERSACQQHFLDLCDVLGQPTPAAADPTGAWYTFEKGVTKDGGGRGFADVWKKGHFGWEYKGKKKNLTDAYAQLTRYREALENPPLLVVCDLDRFEVHTNFTGFAKKVYRFDLSGLEQAANLAVLRHAFTDPSRLRPDRTQEQVTREVADRFAGLAASLADRGVDSLAAGHFLMKLMFCMFAEDVGLLPENLFLNTVTSRKNAPAKLAGALGELFAKMNTGGWFGPDEIDRFNGRLFADPSVVALTPAEIGEVVAAAGCDWSSVEPSIFGTLFERILNPAKRSQLGAHYTGRADIETLLKPVLVEPLRREWRAARDDADAADARRKKVKTAKAKADAAAEFDRAVDGFLARLAGVTVLDPACGSGNFLYVALHMLLDLEKEVLTYVAGKTGQTRFPGVRPTQLHGVEVNVYARELAQVVIWIGFIQWVRFNGFQPPRDPVLEPMESIERRDAVLDLSDPAKPREPEWPGAEFIVGNPPFLGDKKMRGELGDVYVDALRRVYAGRLPGQSDLCCYWFEKARAKIAAGAVKRAGLIATQAIRGGANRTCLHRIKDSGGIFFAESDRGWVLDGANVRTSIIGFDAGEEKNRVLDGAPVAEIHSNLTAVVDSTRATPLGENASLSFIGVSMHGDFDFDEDVAGPMLQPAGNVNGRPNSDVVLPIVNGAQVVKNLAPRWAVFFPPTSDEAEASMYQSPFEYVLQRVKPVRSKNPRASYRQRWWIHGEPRPAMFNEMSPHARFIGTPRVAKHRAFFWLNAPIVPSDQIVVIARSDDFTFGVLHSRFHEHWSLRMGTRLEDRPRYTPTTCFEAFPFPEPNDAHRAEITAAAKQLDELRRNWLNPPEWTREEVLTFPGSVDGPWRRFVRDPDAKGVGTVHYPRTVAKDATSAALLKKRTLTALYNERPAWLANLHKRLDSAVAAAYGWPDTLSDDEVLARLLALNLERAAAGVAPVEVET